MISLVKFGATWCGPCKKLQPTLDKLKEEFPDVTFQEVDVDDEPELAKQYEIKSIPTLVFLENDKEINRVVGLSLIQPLRTLLRDAQNS